MTNTSQNVITVVGVLIKSCHVSLKPINGPRKAHNTTMSKDAINAIGLPAIQAHHVEKALKRFDAMLFPFGADGELSKSRLASYKDATLPLSYIGLINHFNFSKEPLRGFVIEFTVIFPRIKLIVDGKAFICFRFIQTTHTTAALEIVLC